MVAAYTWYSIAATSEAQLGPSMQRKVEGGKLFLDSINERLRFMGSLMSEAEIAEAQRQAASIWATRPPSMR